MKSLCARMCMWCVCMIESVKRLKAFYMNDLIVSKANVGNDSKHYNE